jgi:tRNA-Thr(GGU) m(6)t(6)A37 methyltransferase TsaA
MNLDQITFHPIGVIRSPFNDPVGMPIQPGGARGIRGEVEVDPAFVGGLADLHEFSRIILLYAFHRSEGYRLRVVPFLDTSEHGVFATRAPRRPNPIGLSVVRLVGVDGCQLQIEDIDILDGTPLLDIKPYVPSFDAFPDEKAGWFDRTRQEIHDVRSDCRFADAEPSEHEDPWEA